MDEKILNTDTVILRTNFDLSFIGKVETTEIRSKKLGNFSLNIFAGCKFNIWYEFDEDMQPKEFDSKLVIYERENRSVKSNIKYNSKKIKKRTKLMIVQKLSAVNYLDYIKMKEPLAVNYISHAEVSYMSLFSFPTDNILLWDFKKGYFSFNLQQKGCKNVTTITNSDYFILKYLEQRIKTVEPHKKLTEQFDTFYILSNFNVIEILEFYKENYRQLIIFVQSRILATRIFKYLFHSKYFIQVKMVDFLFREYQVDENIHPIMRGDTTPGYIITALKIKPKNCNGNGEAVIHETSQVED